MARLSIYTLLVLSFLGISKIFSPYEQKVKMVQDNSALSWNFKERPISLILTDAFQAGFLLKTYYLKLRIIYGFKNMKTVVIKTSGEFYRSHLPNRGMSIFRRSDLGAQESFIPLPPGSLYIGNLTYGRWKKHPLGDKFWVFHNAYKNYPAIFLWGDFKPSLEFYKMLDFSLKNSKPFYGLNHEFGTGGSVTKNQFIFHTKDRTDQAQISLKRYMRKFISIPPWSAKGAKHE